MRLVLLPALAAVLACALPASATPLMPQIVDGRGDANFVNGQGFDTMGTAPSNMATPVGSQAYGDVTAVLFQPVRSRGKVTGFTVTMTLLGAPTPPAGTVLVYRVLGTARGCPYFGVAYYTSKVTGNPRSAIRDNCAGRPSARLTPLAPPVVKDGTITWTVPLRAIPKDTGVKAGTTLSKLYFTVTEIEDFRGQQVPAGVPVYGGATGLGSGVIDDSTPSWGKFRIG
jgi:hypothetical protein